MAQLNEDQRVWSGRSTLPVLHSVDVVVAGGGFAAVAAALDLARAGRKVMVVEPRTYLGREITATLRPWIKFSADSASGNLWSVLATRLNLYPGDAEIPLKMDALKLALEDLLLEAGVELLYASYPVGLVVGESGVAALIIGNKSGRQALRADLIIDASEAASVLRLADANFTASAGLPSLYTRVLEFDGANSPELGVLPVPRQLGLADDTIRLHNGYRGVGHVLAEFDLDMPFEDGPWAFAARESAARDAGMRLASYLLSEDRSFAGATLAAGSYELLGPQTHALVAERPEWAREADTISLPLPGRPQLSQLAGPVPGLWVLNEAVQLPAAASLWRDPAGAALIGAAFASTYIESALTLGLGAGWHPTTVEVAAPLAGDLQVREPESPQRGRAYQQQQIAPGAIKIIDRTEVLVVGGGTSGATAVSTAAREGAATTLVEMNPGLGGTGTIGGVDSYWYGRDKVGFAARVSSLTTAVQRSICYVKPKWNIEAKMYALLRETADAGVDAIFHGITTGAVVAGKRVRGVVVASRWGWLALLADVVIDATGDGDVAAFAGAEYVYGSQRDHTVMWYSLAQFATPGRTRNNFTSMIDIGNVEDYTRGILAGRRRGVEVHDHGAYLAPRETRHILGDVVLTLADQLRRRTWPDVVNIHYSNHDVKGPTDSPWIRVGLIPPNMESEIPYRAILPRQLEGIIITGKAISATHDALPAIRMQADLENLGGVAGVAAALAVSAKKLPREISLAELQRRMIEYGILPADVLTRDLTPEQLSDAQMEALIDSIAGDKPLYTYSDMDMGELFRELIPFVEVSAAGPEIVPHLERALENAGGFRRVLLAQALAMHGSPAAVPVLLAAVAEQLQGDGLPVRDSNIRHAGFPPDQGAMPDVVYLLNSLAMVPDHRVLPLLAQIAAMLPASEEDIRDRRKGTFYYVDALCSCAETLGDPAAIPMLKRLHSYPTLRDQHMASGAQADFFLERQALLEVMVGRALARCGSSQGVRILVTYLDDARRLLAEGAHSELVAISGHDFGKSRERWLQWLAEQGASLALRPLPPVRPTA